MVSYFGIKAASKRGRFSLPDFRFGYAPDELERLLTSGEDTKFWFMVAELLDAILLVPSYVALEAAGMGKLWRRNRNFAALPLIGGVADWIENGCHLYCAWTGTIVTEVAQVGSFFCQLKWCIIGVANFLLSIGWIMGKGTQQKRD